MSWSAARAYNAAYPNVICDWPTFVSSSESADSAVAEVVRRRVCAYPDAAFVIAIYARVALHFALTSGAVRSHFSKRRSRFARDTIPLYNFSRMAISTIPSIPAP